MKWSNILAKSNLRVIDKSWKEAHQVEGDLETHIICHSLGGKCLNLKKTKLFTPLAMLGFSSGGFSRSSCTEGVDVSKT